VLVGSLEFVLWIVAKLLCTCLCLFDAIVELHPIIDDKIFNTFFFEKQKWILYVIKVTNVQYMEASQNHFLSPRNCYKGNL